MLNIHLIRNTEITQSHYIKLTLGWYVKNSTKILTKIQDAFTMYKYYVKSFGERIFSKDEE